MKRSIFLVIAATLIAVTTYGQMGNRSFKFYGSGDRYGYGLNDDCRIVNVIDNLTDSQKEQIEEIRYDHQLQALELRNEIDKNRLELRKIRRSDNPDKDAIINLVEKNGELRTALQKSRVEMMFEVESVLTEDQLDQWRELRNNSGYFGKRFKGERNFKRNSPRLQRNFGNWN